VAVGYRHLQRVEVVGDRGEFEDLDPEIVRGVIETEDGELVATEEFDNDLTNRYPDSEVEVTDVENAFVFDVETDGSFDVDPLVKAGIGTIEDRANELKDAIQL
jgi:DNA-directed RNA polymerase subunit D